MNNDNEDSAGKRRIDRAGLIPYFIGDDDIEMLFMKPSDPKYGGSEFQIAKGKLDPGESAEEAATREASEELGLFRKNLKSIHPLGKFLGRTTIYVAEIEDKDLFGDPHFETGDTKWMTLDEFLKSGRPLHKPIIKAAFRRIEEILDR